MNRIQSLACMSTLILTPASFAGEIDEFREMFDLSSDKPEVAFDVPSQIVACDITTEDYSAKQPGRRLIEIEIPVSLLLYHGQPSRIEDVIIEIEANDSGLQVYDYMPRTLLTSDITKPIEQRQTSAIDKSIGGSLGGKFGTDIAITPTIDGGVSKSDATTETRSVAPPKQAIVVSGTLNNRRGAFFKIRPSSQTTLEGERSFKVTFSTPNDWDGGEIAIRCYARGQQKMLMIEKQRVWNQTIASAEIQVASHN